MTEILPKYSLYKLSAVFVIILSGILMPASSNGQTKDIAPAVTKAVIDSDATELVKYFNEKVNLSIPGSDGLFSKEQAEVILENFFAKIKVTSFKINHKGGSGEGSLYYIGVLSTKERKYTTYFLLRVIQGKQVIQQLQMEAD